MDRAKGDDGWIKIISPVIRAPSLKDNRGDVDRLAKGVGKALQSERVCVGFSLINRLPSLLRENTQKG